MRKIILGIIVVFLSLSTQVFAQGGGTGEYKVHNAGIDVKVVKKPKKPRNSPFIGLNAGIGGTVGAVTSLDGSLGADFAFAPSKKFAMGFFTGYETFTKINAGLLFVHGDYSSRGAFMWGIGASYIWSYSRYEIFANQGFEAKFGDGGRFLLRFGYIMPRTRWYSHLTLSYGSLYRRDDYYYDYGYGGTRPIVGCVLSIGYRLTANKSEQTK